jgi:hypothetical protein
VAEVVDCETGPVVSVFIMDEVVETGGKQPCVVPVIMVRLPLIVRVLVYAVGAQMTG